MTSLRGGALPFLFLFFLFAVLPNLGTAQSYVLMTPHPESGYYHFFLWVNQSVCVNYYGLGNPPCAVDGRSFYMRFDASLNGTTNIWVRSKNPLTAWSCSGDGKQCTATADVYSNELTDLIFNTNNPQIPNFGRWLTCDIDAMNYGFSALTSGESVHCGWFGSGYNVSALMAGVSVGIIDTLLGTEVGGGNMLRDVCLVTTDLKSPNPVTCGSGTCWRPNLVKSCVECDVSSNASNCKVRGHVQTDGEAYRCNPSGRWALYSHCADLGWSECGLPSVESCSDSSVTLKNKYFVLGRISFFDSLSRDLQYDSSSDSYALFENQLVNGTAFRVAYKDSLSKYNIQSTDQINSVITWNATEATCTYSKVDGTFAVGDDLYIESSTLSCTLSPGYDSSVLNVNVDMNLTNEVTISLANPRYIKNFEITLKRDIALWDNLQFIYVNSTHIAVSGHIIRYSDLTDIPEASNPYVNMTLLMYDRDHKTLQKLYANILAYQTDDNALFYNLSSGGAIASDVIHYQGFVGADDYITTNYTVRGFDENKITPYRLLNLKCRHEPSAVEISAALGSYYTSTAPVKVICSYQLVNESALTASQLISGSSITAYNQLGADVQEDSMYADGMVFFPSSRNMTYSNSIGTEIIFTIDALGYLRLYDGTGINTIVPGRYVGRNIEFWNPLIYKVRAYTAIDVLPPGGDYGFSFESDDIVFLGSPYTEGDDVTLRALWKDTNGVVKTWKATIAGSSGHVFDITGNMTNEGLQCREYINGTCAMTSLSVCTGSLGSSGRKCEVVFKLFDAQKCTSYITANDTQSACLTYNHKLFDNGASGTLTGTVTLYAVGNVGAISQSTTTTMTLSGKDFWDISWFPWWVWILGFVLLILLLLIMKWKLQGGRRG